MNTLFLKTGFNLWPPLLGSGIRVKHISKDYSKITALMKPRWYNRNYKKVHFGGSLFSMTDPFYVAMLQLILGKDYIVWDKYSSIKYVSSSKGTAIAHFTVEDSTLSEIREKTASGETFLPEFQIEIINQKSELIAIVKKTIYIRKKTTDNHSKVSTDDKIKA